MSKSIDIDKAGECLRNILDIIRCDFCDKFGRIYRRCVHGHIACDDCSVKEEFCPTCITSSNSPVNKSWVIDEVQSQKAANAFSLLNTFQDTFKTDVYRRQRISEQLKVEKELFPDCIQAPVKYSNKRKSLKSISSIFDKENSHHSYFPGEEISSLQTSRMDKSKYVQLWLDSGNKNSAARKPFANINVNNHRLSGVKLLKNETFHTPSHNIKNSSLKKRKQPSKQSKNKNGRNDCLLKKFSLEHLSKSKDVNMSTIKDILLSDNMNKIKDDSGIAMDEECITIDDSQTEEVDKDELALQAVHEAKRNEFPDDSMHDVDAQYQSNELCFVKVPFEKKSLLYESCPNCIKDAQNYDSLQGQYTNNISITVEYGSKLESNVNTKSVSVQTEIHRINKISDPVTINYESLLFSPKNTIRDNVDIESQDLFTDDINIVNTHVQNNLLVTNDPKTFSRNKENVLIIEDSDTDVEAECLEVAVQVHRTCQPKDYDILSELAVNEMKNRKRRAKRGVTPGSTDSSDKENLDPNRMKRSKCTKKGKKKPNKG